MQALTQRRLLLRGEHAAHRDVPDEVRDNTVPLDRGDDGVLHRVVLADDLLDLAQLDPVSPDLHLGVDPPEVLVLPRRGRPAEVTRAVDPGHGRAVGVDRVGDEALGGELLQVEVAEARAWSPDADLPDLTVRDLPQILVKHVELEFRSFWPVATGVRAGGRGLRRG